MAPPVASAGYSGKPLAEKLGIRPGNRLIVVDAPHGWVGSVLTVPHGVRVGGLRMRSADVILLFTPSRSTLEARRHGVLARLPATGSLWVAWPKRSRPISTDVTEDVVRAAFLPGGLVDVKVAALDATWSGLKFVVRTAVRSAWPHPGAAGPGP